MKTCDVMGAMGIRQAFASDMAGTCGDRAVLCHKPGVRRGFVLPGGLAAGLVVLLWMACAVVPLRASELHPLTIALVESGGNGYIDPVGGRIEIRSHPVSLYIRIRNTSEAAVLIRVRPEVAYSIELKDQAGLTFMVKRKKSTGGASEEDIRVELAPGADKIIPVLIDRDTWQGFPNLEAGKVSKYAARVVYETADGQLVYSAPRTLIFRISP